MPMEEQPKRTPLASAHPPRHRDKRCQTLVAGLEAQEAASATPAASQLDTRPAVRSLCAMLRRGTGGERRARRTSGRLHSCRRQAEAM